MHLNNKTVGYGTIIFLILFFFLSISYVYHTRYYGWYIRTVYSDNVGNLKPDNPLKVNGLIMGKVRSISRVNGMACITLKMRREVIIKKDYSLINVDVGLMGDRCLVLLPGFAEETIGYTEPLTAQFVPGIAEGIANAASLSDVVAELVAIFRTYAQTDLNNDSLFTTKFHKVIRHIDTVTLKIERILLANERVLDENIRTVSMFSHESRIFLKKSRSQIQNQIRNTRALSIKSVALIDSLEPLIGELSSLLEKTNRGENRIGAIIEDKKLYDNLLKALMKIRELIRTAGSEGVKLNLDLF